MITLNIIYEIVVLANFLFSAYLLIKKKPGQQFHLYVYTFFVVVVDLVLARVKKEYPINSNYSFYLLILISYIYFYYFFLKNFKDKIYSKIWTVISTIFFIMTLMFQVQSNFGQFSPVIITLLSLFYIFGSMGWFTYILSQKVEGEIFDKMAFWISSGLLIWSVFFLFRALPMYYFNTTDPTFLQNISSIFTIINIITYLFFFRSLFCKQ